MCNEVQVRWMIRRDMVGVLAIENASFENPWTEECVLSALRQRHCIGMVAEREARIAGFMIYELHKGQIRLINFAVHPACRRERVGEAMITRLVGKLAPLRRDEIVLEVRETNLAAQLFFRAMGFLAVGVLRNHYDDCDEDAYSMRYSIVPGGDFAPVNRIAPLTLGSR